MIVFRSMHDIAAHCLQEDYVVTPLKAIMNSGKIANSVTSAAGCTDGPACM